MEDNVNDVYQVGRMIFRLISSLVLIASASSFQGLAIANVKDQSQLIKYGKGHRVNGQINPIFKPILPQLKQKTQIKILLPQYIPESDGENPIYAIIETATRNQYEILLGFLPDCNGGTACRLGFVSAEAVTLKTPRLTGKPVSLGRSVTGYFLPSYCGANCSDATLTWRQKGVQYVVGIKAGDRATLVKMANSAILP